MSRRRAGHAWTSVRIGKNLVDFIFSESLGWITSGEAQGWRRCPRCRVPFENDPFDSGLCVICYFYKTGLSSDRFWELHKKGYWLAPYRIGDRVTATHHKMVLLKRRDRMKAASTADARDT